MFGLGLCHKAGLEINRVAGELQHWNSEVRGHRDQLQKRKKPPTPHHFCGAFIISAVAGSFLAQALNEEPLFCVLLQ